MATLHSSAPGIFNALLKLVREAAAEQSQPVAVFDYEVGQYEPKTYITVHAIENHRWASEALQYQMNETYEVCGCASIFTGDSPFDNPTMNIGSQVLEETQALFETCVMAQVVSNRTAPFLNTEGPTPQIMLPAQTDYKAGPTNIGGWAGELDWRFSFEAIINAA